MSSAPAAMIVPALISPYHSGGRQPFRFAGRIPIVVGVTGHRDLDQDAAAPDSENPRRKVELALREILDQHPHTPVILLTALAEGADTLAAEVACTLATEPRYQQPSGASRIAYAVALPMPLSACAADFSDPGHVAHVSSLCQEAIVQYEIPLKEGINKGDLAQAPMARQEQYQRLAAHIVQHSHVLLALWDGMESKPGGTAEVVRWFLEGVPQDRHADPSAVDVLRSGPGVKLVHIPVARKGATAGGEARKVLGKDPGSVPQVLAQMEEFNKDVLGIPGDAEARISGARASLGLATLSEPSGEWIPAATLDPLLETYAASDFLARRNRGRRKWTTILLFTFAVISLAAFEIYSHLWADKPWLLFLYVVTFVCSFLVVRCARDARVENKFLVYRSLAEALRVQIAWAGGGVRASVSDNYQPLHDNEIAWVRHSLKGLAVLAGDPVDSLTANLRERAAAVSWALRTWVQAEVQWFSEKITGLHAKSFWCHLIFYGCMGTGAVVASILFLQEQFHLLREDFFNHGLALVTIVGLIAFGALAQAYGHQAAYKSSARRYEAARFVFRRAADLVEQGLRQSTPAGLDQAEAALHSLGREALTENVNWLLLYRDHELHVKAGG